MLIIDDDFVSLELLQSTLAQCGHKTYTLPSAVGAMRLIAKERVAVVVLDLNLPQVQGEKVARMLRRHQQTRDVGLVLVSGRPADEMNAVARQVQADSAVQKSEVRTALAGAVRVAFQGHSARHASG